MRVEQGVAGPVGGFDMVEGREAWHTPWGGPADVRSMALGDDAVYVNVHVGGILASPDGGVTWSPTDLDIDTDVHQVFAVEHRVLAALGHSGLASSSDGGRSWTVTTDGLHASYCRAVAASDDRVLLSASSGPRTRHAALYRGRLGGDTFERCEKGLPEWFADNIDTELPGAGRSYRRLRDLRWPGVCVGRRRRFLDRGGGGSPPGQGRRSSPRPDRPAGLPAAHDEIERHDVDGPGFLVGLVQVAVEDPHHRVPGDVLEYRIDEQAMRSLGPGRIGNEGPRLLAGRDTGFAGDNPRRSGHGQAVLEEGPVQGSIKPGHQRLTTAGLGDVEDPGPGVDPAAEIRADVVAPAIVGDHRDSGGVAESLAPLPAPPRRPPRSGNRPPDEAPVPA